MTNKKHASAYSNNKFFFYFNRGGNAWLLDVAVVLAATATKVRVCKTHKVPGAAAQHYHAVKRKRYAGVANLVPIVIECGGRWDHRSRDFVDELIDHTVPNYKAWRSRLFRDVCSALTRYQSFMLSQRVFEIDQARRQFYANAQHRRDHGGQQQQQQQQ